MRLRGKRYSLFIPLLVLLFVGQTNSAPQARQAPPPASFEQSVKPVLVRSCYGCHNSKLQTAGLDLEAYPTAASIEQDPHTWDKVVEKLKTGKMPPPGSPRPSEGEIQLVTAWLEAHIARAERLTMPNPGRVTARRLNRAEYNNTVKDLLGVDFRPADEFPQDDSGYGFDNNGDVLSLSVVQMEKYLNAAETVARTAIYGPQWARPMVARYQPWGRRRPGDPDNLFFNVYPTLSITNYDESGLSMPNSFHVKHYFPATGEYVLRMTPDNGSRPPGSEPLEVGAWIDGKLVGTSSVEGSLEGKTQEFRTRVTAGEHWVAFGFPRQFEGLPVAYGGKNPSKRPVPEGRGRRFGLNGAPGGGGPPALPPNATPEQIKAFEARRAALAADRGPGRGGQPNPNANNNNDAANANLGFVPPGAPPGTRLARPDNMGIQSIEIGGPHNGEIRPPQESRQKIYVCGHLDGGHQAACVRKIVSHLARMAYRRPVTRQEVHTLMSHAIRARDRGDSMEEQLVVTLQAMLVSPYFLFRIEKDPTAKSGAAKVVRTSTGKRAAGAGDAYYLSDHELASRLSYFLWASMPDAELLGVADRGTLRRPEILTAQVHRMLKDPKMRRFVRNFGGQWLQIRALESHLPDFYKFPRYDGYLRISMVEETETFFEHLIQEDRSILEFLDADYTYANEYLARFYGIDGVTGPEFRKVSLAETPRRGILGHASVLTASSYANRTSVVLRGKWILENLLNSPPPPPPPDVPDLEEAKIGEEVSLRERMEAHRSNATCASCHSRMDPLGFGLENFDATGNWREKDGKIPVDASGTLPDGRAFRGPVELARLLRGEKDAFTRAMTEKMLIYALGRGLEPFDRPAIKKIAGGVAASQYRFSSVVLEIVKSMPFQMRRGDRGRV
jgi:hypothetical protein